MKKVIVLFTFSCTLMLFTQAQNVQRKKEPVPDVIQQVGRGGPDRDGDGVPDSRDKELITPTFCQPVDADGVGKCPDPSCCSTLKTSTGTMTDKNETELVQNMLLKTQASEIQKLNSKLEELTRIVNSLLSERSKPTVKKEILKLTSSPNPTNQYFNIKLESNNNQPYTLTVRDVVGRLIEERSGLNGKVILQLGISYSPGTYVIEAKQGKEHSSLMLVKQ